MIEKTTIPYEILIRLGPAGYQAAHVIDIERLVDSDTGTVEAEKELPPRAISVETAGTYFNETALQMAEQIDSLNVALAAETQRANQAEAALAAAQAELEAALATPAVNTGAEETPLPEGAV